MPEQLKNYRKKKVSAPQPCIMIKIFTCGDHDLDADVLAELDGDLRGLQGQLPSRDHNHTLKRRL